jgi:hypothetical protein
MEVSGQLHDRPLYPQGKSPWIGGWVGPRCAVNFFMNIAVVPKYLNFTFSEAFLAMEALCNI